MPGNPLEQYFRKPAIYIELPSKGNFYGEEQPKLSADGELAVLGMTAKDELTLKNPDALLNGEGIITVLQSVVPDIPDPRKIPISDFNCILIGMRIASYGKEMDYSIACVECNNIDNVSFDLYEILATVTSLDNEYIVELENGVKIGLKSMMTDKLVRSVIDMTDQGHSMRKMETELKYQMKYYKNLITE